MRMMLQDAGRDLQTDAMADVDASVPRVHGDMAETTEASTECCVLWNAVAAYQVEERSEPTDVAMAVRSQ